MAQCCQIYIRNFQTARKNSFVKNSIQKNVCKSTELYKLYLVKSFVNYVRKFDNTGPWLTDLKYVIRLCLNYQSNVPHSIIRQVSVITIWLYSDRMHRNLFVLTAFIGKFKATESGPILYNNLSRWLAKIQCLNCCLCLCQKSYSVNT